MNKDLCEKCGVGIEESPGGCGCKYECKTDLHENISIYWHPIKKLWVSEKEIKNDKSFKN